MNLDQTGTASGIGWTGSKNRTGKFSCAARTLISCVADKRSRPGERTGVQRSSGICFGAKRLIMKFALIAVGLLAIIGQVPPAFGRAGGIHAEVINGLPPEIRNVLG